LESAKSRGLTQVSEMDAYGKSSENPERESSPAWEVGY
jgi:hypothetical protein